MFIPSPVATAGVADRLTGLNLTAGALAADTGFVTGLYGSLGPETSHQGFNILTIVTKGDSNILEVVFSGAGIPNEDTVINQFKITGTFNTGTLSLTFNRSDATYNPNVNGNTRWQWTNNNLMIEGNVYVIEITTLQSTLPIFGRNGWNMSGAYQINSADEQFVVEPDKTWNAEKDLLIAQHFGFDEGPVNQFTGYYKGLKEINPELKIMPYQAPGVASKDGVGTGNPDWTRRLIDTYGNDTWFLRNAQGDLLESEFSAANIRASYCGQFQTPNANGRTYMDEVMFRGHENQDKVLSNGRQLDFIDGMYWDVIPPAQQKVYELDTTNPRVQDVEDMNQDGISESRSDETIPADPQDEDGYGGVRMYRRGVMLGVDAFESIYPSNFAIFRNSTRDGIEYSSGTLTDGQPREDSEFYQRWGGGIYERVSASLCCARDSSNNNYPYQGFNGWSQQCRHTQRIKSSNKLEADHPWGKFGEHAIIMEAEALNRTPTQEDFEWARYHWFFALINGTAAGLSRGKNRAFPLLDEQVLYLGDTVDGLIPTTGVFDPTVGAGGSNADFTLRSPDYQDGSADFYWQLYKLTDGQYAGTRFCALGRTDAGDIASAGGLHGDGTPATCLLPDYGPGNQGWRFINSAGAYVNPHTGQAYRNQSPLINDGQPVDAGGSFGAIDMLPFHSRLLVSIPSDTSNVVYTVTAGDVASNTGFSTILGIGSLSPDQPYDGNVIEVLLYTSGNEFWYEIDGSNVPNDDATFRTLTVQTQTGDVIYNRADATYQQSGGNSRWVWPASGNWVNAGNYSVTIEYQNSVASFAYF